MSQMAGVKPTSQQSGLPAPSGAPDAGAQQQQQAPADAGGGDEGAQLSTSPVSAEAAASAANQQQAAAAQQADAQAGGEQQQQAAPAATQTLTPIDTGNEAFNKVSSLLAEKGVDGTHILAEASAGEVSLANKAKLVEELGETVATMALDALSTEVTRQREAGAAEATRQQQYIGQALGLEGEAAGTAWEAVRDFVKSPESGYTEADIDAINTMLKAGGPQANMAINDAIARYKQSANYTQVPNLTAGDAPGAGSFKPISRAEYQTAMREAVAKHGENSREVEALRQRRTISIKRRLA